MTAEQHDRLVRRFSQGWSINSIEKILQDRIDNGECTHDERDKVIDEILSNKDVLIKKLLGYLRDDCFSTINYLIKFSRKEGYDYPEFKAIETSMKSELKESFESLDCCIDSIYYEHPYDSPSGYITVQMSFSGVTGRRLWLHYYYQDQRLVHDAPTHQIEEVWKSHEADIKKVALKGIEQELGDIVTLEHQAIRKEVLTCYRRGEYSTVEYIILASKLTGRNYPEFPAIEKSLKHVRP